MLDSAKAGGIGNMDLDGSARAVARFNRLCSALAAGWMLLILASVFIRPPGTRDFGQYYMGGLIARLGEWNSLYPIPHPDAKANAGWQAYSTMHPVYADLARRHGVGDVNRFIHPPPWALVFVPLSLLGYEWAFRVWIVLMLACVWGVAFLSGALAEIVAGRPSRLRGLLILIVAASPLSYRVVRTGNISALVALSVAVTILAIARSQTMRGAIAIVVGAASKYATVLLILLALACRRWKMVALALILGAVGLAAPAALTGAGPYQVFSQTIAPTSEWPHVWRGNQSLQGFVMRVAGTHALSLFQIRAIKAAALLLLAGLVLLLHRRRKAVRESPVLLLAGAAALIGWLPLFAPIFWEHYFIYFGPVAGWLVWEMRQSRIRLAVGAAAALLIWLPLVAVPRIPLPEPLGSHMLIGAMLILGLAVARLAQGEDRVKQTLRLGPGAPPGGPRPRESA